jgi:type III secretory pathway component EscU
MKFLEKLFRPILLKNLILYNLLVTLSVIIIFFILFIVFSLIALIAVTTYSSVNGLASSMLLESIVIAIVLPISFGIIDFVFCIFLLFKNLKFAKPENIEVL